MGWLGGDIRWRGGDGDAVERPVGVSGDRDHGAAWLRSHHFLPSGNGVLLSYQRWRAFVYHGGMKRVAESEEDTLQTTVLFEHNWRVSSWMKIFLFIRVYAEFPLMAAAWIKRIA